jgi:peptide/nickel transport system permease protein
MAGYIFRRILAVIPVMAIVAIFVFLLLRLTPGDPAAILAGDAATPAQLERIRERLGLADPICTSSSSGGWASSSAAISECR